MKYTKRFLLAAIAAGALLAAAPAYADLKFGVAAEPYAPFTSKNASGVWEGWEIDFMNAVCAEIGEKCSVEEVAWDGIIPALQAKKFDAIMASMLITAKRKETIDFTNMYYDSAAVLIGPKNDDKDISPEHLSGKTVGVQVSTAHARYMAKYYEPKGTAVKTYATQDEANADLAAGRLDYVLANGTALDAFLSTEQGSCCEQKAAVPRDAELYGEGVGLGIRKEDAALRDKFNAGIKAMAAKGTFEQISAKWNLTGKLVLPTP